MSRLLPAVAALAAALLSTCLPNASASAAERTNVIVILADDLGYSDLGVYGGEIDTPVLDDLAAEGLQFSHYRTTTMCVTSRVALLSGMEYHLAGKQAMTQARPLANVLNQSGYRTIAVGKWHLAGTPTDEHNGFDRFFGFLGGQTNCFEAGPDWIKDGKPFVDVPSDFYSTDAFTDYAIEEIDSALDADEPFFVYLAHNAPHVPLQAPEANIRKYLDRGVYNDGWLPIRTQRIERLIKLGLIGPDNTFPPPTSDVEPWHLLTQQEQKLETLKQAAYAGMIDRLDEKTGDLLDHLEAKGILDETLIIFASDNGADFVGIDTNFDALPWDRSTSHAYERFTGSNGWAYANNAPFKWYKHAGHEGGIAAPLIVRWPAGIETAAGTLLHQNVRVWDLYPTILQAAGVTHEPTGQERPVAGKPLQPMFVDADAPGYDRFISSFSYTRGIVDGRWKLASMFTNPWELYDLETDRTETKNLAASNPQKLAEMIAIWDAFVEEAGNVPADWNQPRGETFYWMHQRMPPGLASVSPKMSEPDAPLDAKLTMTFIGDIEFKDEKGVGMDGTIRLMKYGQVEPVWVVDPTPAHLSGPRTLVFDQTPLLEPESMYYLLWDNDVLRVQGPDGRMNRLHQERNAAYGWRFTTSHTEAADTKN